MSTALKPSARPGPTSPAPTRAPTSPWEQALLESVGFDRDQMRWIQKQRNALGWFLLDTCSQIGLCEEKKVLREEDIQKKQEPLTLVRPAASLIDNFQEVTQQVANGRMVSYPMIEPPVKWEYQDRPGIHNTTGGYHNPVYRESHPMVRTRWEACRLAYLSSVVHSTKVAALTTKLLRPQKTYAERATSSAMWVRRLSSSRKSVSNLGSSITLRSVLLQLGPRWWLRAAGPDNQGVIGNSSIGISDT